MRKSIFYLSAVATMAFVSCAQDETIEINQGKDIRFNVLTNSMTRAADVDIKSLGSFKVETLQGDKLGSAIKVWEDTYTSTSGIAGSGTGNDFTGRNTHFWPADGTPLHFFAYNEEALSNGSVSVVGSAQSISGVTPAASAADQKDLIVAYATGSETVNSQTAVSINFKHVLTKIIIQGKNTNPSLKVDVLGVRINGLNNTATLTWPLNTANDALLENTIWKEHSNSNNKTGDYKAVPTNYSTTPLTLGKDARSLMDVDSNTRNGAFMVLPQDLVAWDRGGTTVANGGGEPNGAYISVLCRIYQASGNDKVNNGWTQVFPNPTTQKDKFAWTAVALSGSWYPGSCYTYTLDFSKGAGTTDPDQPTKPTDPEVPVDPNKPVLGDAIKLTVSVSKWNDAQSPDFNGNTSM